jgi:hypothetical protein
MEPVFKQDQSLPDEYALPFATVYHPILDTVKTKNGKNSDN